MNLIRIIFITAVRMGLMSACGWLGIQATPEQLSNAANVIAIVFSIVGVALIERYAPSFKEKFFAFIAPKPEEAE